MNATDDPHDGWRSARDLRVRATERGYVYNCMVCGASADVTCDYDKLPSVVANHEAKCSGTAPDETVDPTKHSMWEANRAHEQKHGRAPDVQL